MEHHNDYAGTLEVRIAELEAHVAALTKERDAATARYEGALDHLEKTAKLESDLARAREALTAALPAIAAVAEASHLMDGFGPRRHTAEDSILAKLKSALTHGGNDER